MDYSRSLITPESILKEPLRHHSYNSSRITCMNGHLQSITYTYLLLLGALSSCSPVLRMETCSRVRTLRPRRRIHPALRRRVRAHLGRTRERSAHDCSHLGRMLALPAHAHRFQENFWRDHPYAAALPKPRGCGRTTRAERCGTGRERTLQWGESARCRGERRAHRWRGEKTVTATGPLREGGEW
jgi:hypothetical protein